MGERFHRIAFDAAPAAGAAELYAEIRRAVFDRDFGQNSWLTAREQDQMIATLGLGRDHRVLDVACGAGGPALRLAGVAGCRVVGIEVAARRVRQARSAACAAGLGTRARFERIDASEPLPFATGSFGAVVCVDAISVLGDRRAVMADWGRVLAPGGHVAVTDGAVRTGPLSTHELDMRGGIDGFAFAAPGENELALAGAGLEVVARIDTTPTLAALAARWREARRVRSAALRALEGDESYEGQQEFFAVTARTAREGRLSRFLYVARRR